MRKWHLIYTKPRQEPLVNQQLEDRDLEVFFPYLWVERDYGRPKRREPFFPNYLFARVDLNAAEATGLRWLVGVNTFVEFGGAPAVVPDELMECLQERLEPLRDKVVRKDEPLFEPNQPVEITDGPLAGFEALFQRTVSGGDRVQILLNAVGSLSRAEVDRRHIRPLPSR